MTHLDRQARTAPACGGLLGQKGVSVHEGHDGPCGTHVMVSIMSRPISTQQWAWSVLGWVRPDTQ